MVRGHLYSWSASSGIVILHFTDVSKVSVDCTCVCAVVCSGKAFCYQDCTIASGRVAIANYDTRIGGRISGRMDENGKQKAYLVFMLT